MLPVDAAEASEVIYRMLEALAKTVRGSSGLTNSGLRRVIGDMHANANAFLRDNNPDLTTDLAECFNVARLHGATLLRMEHVRNTMLAEHPVGLPAVLMAQLGVLYCLMTESRIIAATKFVSRQDVTAMINKMNIAFNAAEEVAADEMDSAIYRALISLHATVIFHLTETARPLPRMINFVFDLSYPTLVTAHTLYADSRRADELRAENKVVHPLFQRREGQALSA